MTEKKLFGFNLIEGGLLLVLGLCTLILPKLTPVSFHLIVGVSFVLYGIYKFVNSILTRNYAGSFVCEMISGIFMTVLGILLFFIPKINVFWLIALIGVAFIAESIHCAASKIGYLQTFERCFYKTVTVAAQFLAGLFLIVTIPNLTFATVAMITGVCFVLKGAAKTVLSLIGYKENDFFADDECESE